MYCSSCGMFNNGTNFCTNCGNKLIMNNNQEIGSITIVRPKSIYGCAISYDVYIDNCYMGKISNGDTKQYFVYYGNHIIEILHGINKGKGNFIINEVQKNIVLECPLKMGLITNKIQFNLVNFSN